MNNKDFYFVQYDMYISEINCSRKVALYLRKSLQKRTYINCNSHYNFSQCNIISELNTLVLVVVVIGVFREVESICK